MGYEGGVRVLQSLGNWTPDIPSNVPRPNLIPFTEPYVEGGSMHPASRLKALQQVQQASQGIRKTTQSKCKNFIFVLCMFANAKFCVFVSSTQSIRMHCLWKRIGTKR